MSSATQTLSSWEGEVIEREDLSERVRRVKVRTASPYFFRAGQHVAVRRALQDAEVSYYSFASAQSPEAPEEFELVVRADPSSVIAGRELGEKIWLSPAQGTAVLDRLLPGQGLLLVGVGTGIAPLRALIQEVCFERDSGATPRQLTLFHGCREEGERLFYQEFQRSAAAGRLSYYPVVSRPSYGFEGLQGRVQEHLLEFVRAEHYAVVCGSVEMTEETQRLLLEAGMSPQNIFAEGY